METVEHRTQLHFDEFSRAMLQLPIRLGGVGLCPSAETAPHAFVAGIAAALLGFMGLSNMVKSGMWEIHTTALEVMQTYMNSPVKFDGKRYMADLDTFTKHFCYTKYSSKLQSRIVSAVREHNYSIFSDKKQTGTRRKSTPQRAEEQTLCCGLEGLSPHGRIRSLRRRRCLHASIRHPRAYAWTAKELLLSCHDEPGTCRALRHSETATP